MSKKEENHDDEHIKGNKAKGLLEVNYSDEDECYAMTMLQKREMNIAQAKAKISQKATEMLAILAKKVQRKDKKRDIVIAAVVNHDKRNNDKDEELYNDNSHKVWKETDIIMEKGD